MQNYINYEQQYFCQVSLCVFLEEICSFCFLAPPSDETMI